MTVAQSRSRKTARRRGNATQNMVAAWFAGNGWPYAESAGAGRPGSDVLGMAGWVVEVKARRDFRPLQWLRQHGPGNVAVVHRPDGAGPGTLGGWPVTVRLDTFTRLLHEAGYGDQP
jgi:hypothetical protein